MGNKNTFASNLKKYMDINNKSRRDICDALGFSYYTFSDWVTGKKYPRMDKVEMLANYFGCLKSDLIEDKSEMKKNNEAIADIIVRLRNDQQFRSLVQNIMYLDQAQMVGVEQLLTAFVKQTKD